MDTHFAGTNLTRQILPKGADPASMVHVRENELQLRIDHFSWHIVAFIRSLFTRQIELGCYPLLPRCMPKGRKVTLYVHVYKAKKGMIEVIWIAFTIILNSNSVAKNSLYTYFSTELR